MNPAIIKRFIVLMIILIGISFLGTDVWRRYVQRPPGDYETQLGSQRLEDGLYDEALDFFNQALEKTPNHRGALMGQAISYLRTEDWEKAIAKLDYLIEYLQANLEPDDKTGWGVLAAAYANRGIAHDYAGEHQIALDDYIKSLETDDEVVAGPGVVHKILYGSEKVSSVRDRARYLYEQMQLPESERVLRIPEIDMRQRMHKP